MGDKEDKAALAAGLKAAKTGKMHFTLILKGAADGMLLVSKPAPTGKQIADAKTKCGGTKTVSGECHGEGDLLVFETSENPDPHWAKAVKDISKRDAGQTVQADFRLAAAPGQTAPGQPAATATTGFAPGQAPTRAPAKPGMLGGQRGATTTPALTTPVPTTAPAAPPKTPSPGFTAAQAPARAPSKPGMLGAQRGAPVVTAPTGQAPGMAPTAAPKADASVKAEWQKSIKEVEAPLMQSLKANQGDVGKMKSLFQDSRKQADSGNFDLAMQDIAALRALFGAPETSAPASGENLVDSGKSNATYVSREDESNEEESNEDAAQYVENLKGSSRENESEEEESNEDASQYVDSVAGKSGGNESLESESQSGNAPAPVTAPTGNPILDVEGPIPEQPETAESIANAARLRAAGGEHTADLDQAAQDANAATKAREKQSKKPEAIAARAAAAQNAANFAQTQGSPSSDPTDRDDIGANSSEEEEREEEGSEGNAPNEVQAAQKPAAPAANPLKQFDAYVNQFTATLGEFNAARQSYQEYRDAVYDMAVKSSAEAMEINEMIGQRVGGKDPSQVDAATRETVDFFIMLCASVEEPEAYIRVAAALKPPPKDRKGNVVEDETERNAAEQFLKQARQIAQESRKKADNAKRDFEEQAERKQLLQPLWQAEQAEKAALEIAEQASRASTDALSEYELGAKPKWDRAGSDLKEAEARVKELAATGANQNQRDEARSKVEAAKQALAEARAEYDKAAKDFSDKNVIFVNARQALSDAEETTMVEKRKVEQLPDAALSVAARERAETDEQAVADAERKLNQITFARALGNSGKENPFLTADDRKKIDAFFTKLQKVPEQAAQWEQSAATVRQVAAKMQAIKVDTASLSGSIALQQYAKQFASFARKVLDYVAARLPLDGLETETGFDPSDMSNLKQAKAVLEK